VDGIVLSGYTNQHAVEILKQTGRVVKLKIVRYLRGLRFQELQEGIAQVIQSSTGLYIVLSLFLMISNQRQHL
jgi:hypothetical protein